MLLDTHGCQLGASVLDCLMSILCSHEHTDIQKGNEGSLHRASVQVDLSNFVA